MDEIKYTFMIIPFCLEEGELFEEKKVTDSGFFCSIDHNNIKYERLYKHIVNNVIGEKNIRRTIFDFDIDMQKFLPNMADKLLRFSIIKDGEEKYMVRGLLKNVLMYYFLDGCGFIVLHFIYEENTPLEQLAEVLNCLKKFDREKACFKVKVENREEFEIASLLEEIKKKIGLKIQLFFQHSSRGYVSSVMLNSFLLEGEDVNEQYIQYALDCLKRSQGRSYGTTDNLKYEIHPFKGMYWAFSTQGIANINYVSPEASNKKFYLSFHDNVRQEYLLMTLILLNQEYTLLEFCQKFALVDSDGEISADIEEVNRLFKFKISSTYSTVSHLENYKAFYDTYYETLGIDNILKEVDEKQSSIYRSYRNKVDAKQKKQDKRNSWLLQFFSTIVTLFGITEIAVNVLQLYEKGITSLYALGGIAGSIILICVIVYLFLFIRDRKSDKPFKKRHNNKK